MSNIRLLLFIALLALGISSKATRIKIDSLKEVAVIAYLDSISYYLDSLGVEEVEYVLAQAIYESGWFSCKHCTWNRKNAFGFRGTSGNYMAFSSLRECVIYYANWQKSRYPKYKKKFPGGNYLDFLVWCNYAESNEYIKKIEVTHRWVLCHWAIRRKY